MKKTYLTNPITDELIREGILITQEHQELRIVKDADGNEYEEIAITFRNICKNTIYYYMSL